MKKIVFTVFLFSVLIILCFSIKYMYGTEQMFKIDSKKINRIVENDNKYANNEGYNVEIGDVEKKYILDGIVTDDNNNSKVIYNVRSSSNIFIRKGQTIPDGTILFKEGGKEYYSSSFMKCLNIVKKNGLVEITLLDYSKLYIECIMPIDVVEGNMYQKEYLISDEQNKFKGELDYIDGYVKNKGIYTKFGYENNNNLLIPGSPINIEFTEKKREVVCLPKEYIIIVDAAEQRYEVNLINEDGKCVETEVSVGFIGDNLVEIKSGLSVGDRVLFPSENNTLDNKESGLDSNDRN